MRLIGLVLALGLVLAPLVAEAQPPGKVPRIGLLSPASPSDAGRNPSDLAVLFAALREGLRELGYVEGQNIKIESRWAEGNYDRLPGLAADLVFRIVSHANIGHGILPEGAHGQSRSPDGGQRGSSAGA